MIPMPTSSHDREVLRFDDGGWAERVGGHVALDLVNTVAWRLDSTRTIDRLSDGAALIRWARFVGLLDEDLADAMAAELAGDEAAGQRVVTRIRRAREQLYGVLQPLAVGAQPAQRDVDELRHWLLGVLGRTDVTSVMPLEWSTGLRSLPDLPDRLGLEAWLLLEREDRRRIRQCQDSSCGWLFLDRTRNGSRVWCSSADCGNRTRARRHHQRHAPPTANRQDAGATT
jgi:predicted RNA-binding Zn ribbon-like protein